MVEVLAAIRANRSANGWVGIKLGAQPLVQPMHRQAEFCEKIVSRLPVEPRGHSPRIEMALHLPKTPAERNTFAGLAQLPQQPPHLFRLLARLTDDFERGHLLHAAGSHGFEKGALELPAAGGAVGIHPAAQVGAERSAGLGKFPGP